MEYSDWSIAKPGTGDLVKIGYDYGRLVTGETSEVDLDSYENSTEEDDDEFHEDPTMMDQLHLELEGDKQPRHTNVMEGVLSTSFLIVTCTLMYYIHVLHMLY